MSDSKGVQDQISRRLARTGRSTGRKTLGSALQQARQRKQASEAHSPLDRQDGEDPAFSLGAALKRARQRQGLDLRDVEEYLRIRRIFLEAIEEDRFEDLPGPTYITAFPRSYADLLGISFQDVMERFQREADEKAKQQPKPQLPSPVSENHLPGSIVLVLGIIMAGLVYGGWVWFSGMIEAPPDVVDNLSPPAEEILVQMGVETPKAPPLIVEEMMNPSAAAPVTSPPMATSSILPAATPLADVPAAVTASAVTTTAESSVSGDSADSTTTSEQLAAPTVAILDPPSGEVFGTENLNPRIILRAENGDCWFRIREADGRLVTERILRPGQSYQVPNHPDLTLSVGNAGALKLVVDGTTLPPLGNSGQVRNGIRLNPGQLLPESQAGAQAGAQN